MTQLEKLCYVGHHARVSEVEKTERNLPHWRRHGALYFVTFHLADSVPRSVRRRWIAEREAWLATNPEPWTESQRLEAAKFLSVRRQKWLDAGAGSCLLRRPELSKLVAEAMTHFDGIRYELGDWVVMPNHVHALVAPMKDFKLPQVLHSW